jgi:flavin reductase (DIM6/NTAB) family NADH-FMN oxidoreductase RutF
MREPVELAKCYRLLNHGPTVLVSAAHGGRRNIMAAAWSMPLDFDPPKVAVVIDKTTFTRGLVEGSASFALNVPTRAQAEATLAVGGISARELPAGQDKFDAFGLEVFAGSCIEAPLLEGCAAWLECRLLPEPHIQATYDLFLGEVVAAWADPRLFANGHWRDDADERTLHYIAGGRFFSTGEPFDARATPRRQG